MAPSSSDSDSSPKSPSSSDSTSTGDGGENATSAAQMQSSDESASSDGVLVELPGNQDHEPRGLQGDPDSGILVNIDGSMLEGREDMFVDAPDQLGSARSVRLDESMAMIEIGESSGERSVVADDSERVRCRLEDTLFQCRKYKEEREAFGREVSSLRRQLQEMIDQQPLSATSNEKLFEHLRQIEKEADEDEAFMSPTPLHSMVSDCSKFISHLRGVLDEQLNSEGTIRELHAVLYTKDQEVEDLSVKLSESNVSRDVVVSYLGSLRDVWSESLKEICDVFPKRLLGSLESVIGQERSSSEGSEDDGGITLLEKKTLLLIEKHAQLLSETQKLKQFLAEIRPELLTAQENELGFVYNAAQEELLQSKRKEASLLEHIHKLEEENKTMVEQVNSMKQGLGVANAETNKTKTELEQAENKLAAAREKLSIAVTKGKSLVQHRDQLKQLLSEKTSELEKCMLEWQHKSSALEATEASNEELKQSLTDKTIELDNCFQELQLKSNALETTETIAEELKQLLAEKKNELEKCLLELQLKSDALEDSSTSEKELKQSLADKTSELDKCLLELQEKSDALKTIEINREELKQLLAEKTVELESCLLELRQKSDTLEATEVTAEELRQTLAGKTAELEKCLLDLQEKHNALETSEVHVDELNRSLAEKVIELEKCQLELQQKSDILQAATSTTEQLNETQNLVASLRDSLSNRVRVLQEVEEVMQHVGLPEDLFSMEVVDRVRWFVDQKHKSDGVLLESEKIKDALSSIDLPETVSSSYLESQIAWLGRSFTQAKEDKIKLQEEIDHLAASVLQVKQEKTSLHDEFEELKCNFEKIAEKLCLISSEKDELMKDQGETSSSTLDGQSSFDSYMLIEKCIEKIKERVKTSGTHSGHFEEMQKLLYVKYQELMLCGTMLEEEIVGRSKLLSLSNKLERASEEVIALRNEKESLQKELERVEERSSLLREKLSMAVKKGKGLVQEREGLKHSLEERNTEIEKLKHDLQLNESAVSEYKEQIKSLSVHVELVQKLEADISSLNDLREQSEQSLHKSNNLLQRLIEAIEDIILPTDKIFENPEEKLYWIAEHIHESDAAKEQVGQEFEKLKMEAALQANRLTDAFATIKSLKDELSMAEKHIYNVSEEKKDMQLGKANIDQELEARKQESYMLTSRLEDAYATIRSLEDALAQATNNISVLEAEKDEAESRSKQEIIALNSKLANCTEELEGTRGSLEKQSGEFVNYLGHLKKLIKDEDLFSLMIEEFRKKIEGLKHMDILIQDIHNQFSAKGLLIYKDFKVPGFSSLPKYEDFYGGVFNSVTSAEDLDDATSFTKIVEGIHSQVKLLGDRFKGLSRYMDDHIALTSQTLQAARDAITHIIELSESLKLDINKLEARNEAQEVKMLSLEKDTESLHSACMDATQELQIDFSDLLDFHQELDIMNSSLDFRSMEAVGDVREKGNGEQYSKAAESLLLAAKRIRTFYQQLVDVKRNWAASIDDLRRKLKQAELTAETAIQDRHLSQERLIQMEQDLEQLQTECSEMKVNIEDYQVKESVLRDKEADLMSLQNTLTSKDRDLDNKLFSDDQVKTLLEKVNKVGIPFDKSEAQDGDVDFSSPADKLSYILDKVTELQNRIDALNYEKEDMQLILKSHVREIEDQKKAAETSSTDYQDLELKKIELAELTVGLEKILQRFGGNNLIEDQKPTTGKGFLPAVEKLIVTSNMEVETSKSKIQDLGAMLQVKEKVVDELSTKNKLLEDTIHVRLAQPDIVKERTVFETSTSSMGSEISEIEDVGTLGKSAISPPAAHVRTMRKGSNDHLVLNIDSESDRLISSQETNDKGHVFKSLNTSGLIPKQGKLVADRIDGIWVSGGRMLMSRPRARLSFIAYWIVLHLWLLGTVL